MAGSEVLPEPADVLQDVPKGGGEARDGGAVDVAVVGGDAEAGDVARDELVADVAGAAAGGAESDDGALAAEEARVDVGAADGAEVAEGGGAAGDVLGGEAQLRGELLDAGEVLLELPDALPLDVADDGDQQPAVGGDSNVDVVLGVLHVAVAGELAVHDGVGRQGERHALEEEGGHGQLGIGAFGAFLAVEVAEVGEVEVLTDGDVRDLEGGDHGLGHAAADAVELDELAGAVGAGRAGRGELLDVLAGDLAHGAGGRDLLDVDAELLGQLADAGRGADAGAALPLGALERLAGGARRLRGGALPSCGRCGRLLRVVLGLDVHERGANFNHFARVHVELFDDAGVPAGDVHRGLVALHGAHGLHLLDLVAHGLVPAHELHLGDALPDVAQLEGDGLVVASGAVEVPQGCRAACPSGSEMQQATEHGVRA
ncbi:transcriptional regulatory protein, putative [Babesia caballi]|uniref:Transcriptional regulatory protein, putative n=1 Tax=Babesia caballi TaxID=5871 RepID=A0AAV4LYL1_BABCB|nr:transcriptional regulatory protein, putative [Babesia caballi]